MNNTLKNIIFINFLLFSNDLGAIQDLKCSLQCTPRNCANKVQYLEECMSNCPTLEYIQCWNMGLNALQNSSQPAIQALEKSQKNSLVKRLQSKIQEAEKANKKNYPTNKKHTGSHLVLSSAY